MGYPVVEHEVPSQYLHWSPFVFLARTGYNHSMPKLLAPAAELVKRPQSFEEITSRPCYSAPLDYTEHVLREVLTDYHFGKEIPCGLKSCRQPHMHGFLVLTEDGAETNIGQRCGQTHFGDEVFNRARSEYSRRREREELVARAQQIQAATPQIEHQINDLVQRNFGAKWAMRVTMSLQGVIGSGILEPLRTAALRDELAVTVSRRRTEEEIDDILATNRGMSRERAIYEYQVIGRLLPATWLDFDFRERLIVNLLGPIKAFKEMKPDDMPSPRLKAEVKRFDGAEKTVDDAAEATSSALRFLSHENLELLAQWIPAHLKGSGAALRSWMESSQFRTLLQGAPK